jgi:signal transduction histidine kinase
MPILKLFKSFVGGSAVRHRFLKLKPHPFRILLYVEWILLTMTIIRNLPTHSSLLIGQLVSGISISTEFIPYSWLLASVCLLVFGLMGLRLPMGTPTSKWLYTALEIELIWLGTALGGWRVMFLLPHLVIIIRNILIFKGKERLLGFFLVLLSMTLLVSIYLNNIQTILSALPYPQAVTREKVRLTIITLVVSNIFFFGLVLTLISMLVNVLLLEYQSRQKLTIAHEKLQQYALQIEDKAALQERNRIAREIHDSLGHALTAQSINLENALLFCKSHPKKTQVFLSQAKYLTAIALREVRQSVATLRSNPLEERSLENAINSLIQDVQSRINIIPDYEVSLTHPFSTQINTAIYRIIQEALTNICKHSDATRVTLRLRSHSKRLCLLIEDNGKGFDLEQNTTGFGLQSMRERTIALRGQFYINSAIASGCRITVNIPLAKLDRSFDD